MKGIWKIGTVLTALSLIVTALSGASTKRTNDADKKKMKTVKVRS